MALFLWVDPWVRKCGYALINKDNKIIDAGIILQEKKKITRKDNIERMKELFVFFRDLYSEYDIIATWVEQLFFTARNQQNAEFVYWMRWTLLCLAQEAQSQIYEYTPPELKRAITWNGKAEKDLVQRYVRQMFRLVDDPAYDDAADALGLAYLASRAFTSE